MTAIHHFWLGSLPYSAVVVSGLFPALVEDGVAPGLSVTGGNLVGAPRPIDAMQPGLSLSSGTLESLMAGAGARDALAPGLTLGTCTLSNGTQAHSPLPEGISPGITLSSGTLVSQLIATTYPAEGVQLGLSITSGTLT